MGALEDWAEALESWAIPDEILAAAPISPWTYPVDLFVRRARQVLRDPPSRSAEIALDALPDGGTVLDVGAGAGAASLALVPRAGRIVAVDPSKEMLSVFRELAASAGVEHEAVVGTWPEAASSAGPADVVVCNHVLYNVADLEPFVDALCRDARRRVVVEITTEHPRAEDNNLWLRFHGLERPTRPTADDAERALKELGVQVRREDWTVPRIANMSREELISMVRGELALSPDRDEELAQALGDRLIERDDKWLLGPAERPVVTLWWDAAR